MLQSPAQPLTLDQFFVCSRIPRNERGGVANVFAIAPDWPIDPMEQDVFVYVSDRPTTVYDISAAVLPVPPFAQALSLTIGEIFGWLLDWVEVERDRGMIALHAENRTPNGYSLRV